MEVYPPGFDVDCCCEVLCSLLALTDNRVRIPSITVTEIVAANLDCFGIVLYGLFVIVFGRVYSANIVVTGAIVQIALRGQLQIPPVVLKSLFEVIKQLMAAADPK